jgi:L-ribulose-5-phosphate 3-epimerase
VKNKIGFMQGRLVDSEKKNAIQYFPSKNWKKEIKIAIENNFNLMEWTINIENIKKNFLADSIIDKRKLNFLTKNNFKIESVTCDYFMQKPYFKKKYEKAKYNIIRITKNLIKNCEKLKIKYIVIPLVDNSSITDSLEEKKAISELKKYEKYLKKTNILFEIDYPPKRVLKFIKKFNPYKFGINYDTGNSASLGHEIKDETEYFQYVKNIHIKDRTFRGGSVRLGKGDFDFNFFFHTLNKKKFLYKGNFILQTARSKNNQHLKELKKNFNYLKKFL